MIKKNSQILIPSIDILHGQTVQLQNGDPNKEKVNAGSPIDMVAEFKIAGEIAVIDLDSALGIGSNLDIIKKIANICDCRVGGGIRTYEKAIDLLDCGVNKIIIGTCATPEFLKKLPKNRLIAALDMNSKKVLSHGWTKETKHTVEEKMIELKDYVSGFLVTFVENEGCMTGLDMKRVRELYNIIKDDDIQLTIAGGISTIQELIELDSMGIQGQVGMAIYTGQMNLADAITAPLITDRNDGLYTTVVVDELNKVLGVCYSSKESIRKSVEHLRGVYYSRSRKELWYKGNTSGNIQELLKISMDCDRDTLCFTVKQIGTGFCHLGYRNCFNIESGMDKLYRLLNGRLTDNSSKSYTKKLFNSNSLLQSKIIEEAIEFVEAEEQDHIVKEACDLLYFTFVKCIKNNISLYDIEQELDKRMLKIRKRGGHMKKNVDKILSNYSIKSIK